jgi:hypothetical protein
MQDLETVAPLHAPSGQTWRGEQEDDLPLTVEPPTIRAARRRPPARSS